MKVYGRGALVSLASGLLASLFASTALAQEATATTNAEAQGQVGMGLPGANANATTTTTAVAEPAPGNSDHDLVVGHLGVGYLGLTQLPIGSGGGTGGGGVGNFTGRATLDAPVIGVRYWLSEKMGIDAGLGFTMFSSSTEAQSGATTQTVEGPAAFGVALHGGVPLAFAYAKHYKFLLIPEVNFGITRRGEKQTGTPAPPDINRSGLRIDAGARVGTEIQFGFIGIPELALQATVGLNFRYQNWKSQQDAGQGNAEVSVSQTQTSFGTTVQSDPWALFVNNISALYYFP
jgi:hypothetical protein